MDGIRKSVGKGGRNRPEDVEVVQRLLNRHAKEGRFSKLATDGIVGRRTLGAITAFQKNVMGVRPDGRVDPGKATIRALNGKPGAVEAAAPVSKGKGKVTGKTSGVSSKLLAFLTAVAEHYGVTIPISSGARTPRKQGEVMFDYWTVNLKRGQIYTKLKGTKLGKELDALYRKASGEEKVGAAEKSAAYKEFVATCAKHAVSFSRHVRGTAVDVSPKSALSTRVRNALKTGLRELVENSCLHYDDRGVTIPSVTPSLRSKWK